MAGDLAWVLQKLRASLVLHTGSSFLIQVGKSFQDVQIPHIGHFSLKLVVLVTKKRRRCGIHTSSCFMVLTTFSMAPELPEQCDKSQSICREPLGACGIRQMLHICKYQERESTWDLPPDPQHSHMGCEDEVQSEDEGQTSPLSRIILTWG